MNEAFTRSAHILILHKMSTLLQTKRWPCIKLLLLYNSVFVLINGVDTPTNSETITIDYGYAIGAFEETVWT